MNWNLKVLILKFEMIFQRMAELEEALGHPVPYV
jgi:hypothetical protein